MDGTLGLDGGDGRIDVLGNDIAAVEHAASHVLAVTRVALDHLVGRFEAGVGDLGNGQLLVVGLLGGDDGRVGDQREVDARIGHQIGLEFGQIDVESAIETQRGGDGRDDLADQTVQIGVGGTLNVQIATADVVDGFIVDHESAVRVLQSGVGGQNRVVRLDNGRGHLRSGVDGEFELGFLAVVNRETFHQEGREAGSGAAAERVENEKTLQAGALVGQFADAVQHQVDNLLADGVVAASVIVGRVLLARDQLLGVEQAAVGAGAHLVHHRRLQVDEHGPGNVFTRSRFREERIERVVTPTHRLVARHLTIRLNAVLQTNFQIAINSFHK